MSTFNVEKVTKQITKMAQLQEKIASYQAEYDSISADVYNNLRPNTPSAKVTDTNGHTKTKNKPGSIGEKILSYLQDHPGTAVTTIAKYLKLAPNQAALSLYHLTKKGAAFKGDNDIYFAAVPLPASAKTIPAPMGSYVSPDDEES